MNLATLRVATDAGVVATRGKVRLLAQALGGRDIEASQLAVVVSEVARRLLHPGGAGSPEAEFAFEIDVESIPLGTRLSVSLPDTRGEHAALLESVFGAVHRRGGKLHAEHGFPLHVRDEAPGFLQKLREQLLEKTRSELVSELSLQNQRLERHREELEHTVAERTQELRLSTAKAEQASSAKGEFLSHMSHELRTPLNGVLGYAQILLRDSAATEKQRRSLNAIESCGRHLLTLINDVLDLSKIEAGRMELDARPMDLHALLHAVSDIVTPRAAAKGVALTLELDPAVPRGIVADETKLRQVLVNLLGNSAKFTDEGSISLVAQRAPGKMLWLEVRDTGIGMTEKELKNLFEPFKQAEGGKVAGGTGLGLAITKKVVDAMGGQVTVESKYGEGSVFRVELPLEEAALGDSSSSVPLGAAASLRVPAGQELSVLVVDDVEANRDILASLLGEVGFQCAHAVDGEDALAQMRARRFDLVLMDIRMPKLRGDEAIAIIRADPELRVSKVMAITASVQAGLLSEMLKLGFDDVIGKPFELPKLLDRIGRLLPLEVDAAAVPQAPPAPAASTDFGLLPLERRTALSNAIQEALDLGDIGQLGVLGEALEGDGEPAAELGRQLRAFADAFDFDGLTRLNAQLTGTKG